VPSIRSSFTTPCASQRILAGSSAPGSPPWRLAHAVKTRNHFTGTRNTVDPVSNFAINDIFNVFSCKSLGYCTSGAVDAELSLTFALTVSGTGLSAIFSSVSIPASAGAHAQQIAPSNDKKEHTMIAWTSCSSALGGTLTLHDLIKGSIIPFSHLLLCPSPRHKRRRCTSPGRLRRSQGPGAVFLCLCCLC
jgi:hypothetical protein